MGCCLPPLGTGCLLTVVGPGGLHMRIVTSVFIRYLVKIKIYLSWQKALLIKLPKDRTEVLGYCHKKLQVTVKNAPLVLLYKEESVNTDETKIV